jgi:GNAT superfamily N-acetyltransferase
VRGNALATLTVRPDALGHGYGTARAARAVHEILSRGYYRVTLQCVDGKPAFQLHSRLVFEAVDLENEYAKQYRPESKAREK